MEFIKNIISNIKKFFSRSGSDPSRDWMIFLLMILLLLVISLIFHIILFFRVNYTDSQVISETEVSPVETLDRDKLSKILNDIGERTRNTEFINENVEKIKDPSI